jgi:hypothetical protein
VHIYNTATFIQKANLIHKSKYNYSKSIYVDSKTNLVIICPIHNEFLQSSNRHISQKSGCPKCSCYGNRITQEQFIEQANKIHDFLYDYSLVNYKHRRKSIKIVCKEHGSFFQMPDNHLNGSICPKCQEIKQRMTRDEFISKANEIHLFKYDYSEINYVNRITKLKIRCLDHGFFWQTPKNHLAKNGCMKCNESLGERKIKTILEKHRIQYKQQYKFNNYKYKKPLPFDFAIFKKNKLHGLMEYQGEQHYNPLSFGRNSETFEITSLRDKIKKQYCNENKISFLEIPYWKSENEILLEILNFIHK